MGMGNPLRAIAMIVALAALISHLPAALSSQFPSPVHRIIRRHIHEVVHCYENELIKDPALTGRVVLHLEIGADGLVTQARTESDTIRDSQVLACIAGKAAAWQFSPIFEGRVMIVTYPFVLQPAESPILTA